jgi:hypothetical protein
MHDMLFSGQAAAWHDIVGSSYTRRQSRIRCIFDLKYFISIGSFTIFDLEYFISRFIYIGAL